MVVPWATTMRQKRPESDRQHPRRCEAPPNGLSGLKPNQGSIKPERMAIKAISAELFAFSFCLIL